MSSSTQDSEYNHHEKAKRKSAAGRKLVRWDPGLDQLVLLCVDHVCTKNAIAIPWDDVAELVEPYLTGEAIKQHLVKIYKYRETDGQKVPPKLSANQRRKPFGITGNNDDPAPVTKKNKKGSGGDINKEKPPVEPVKPGGSLLFKAGSKGRKSSKSQGATTTTPATSRGRKQFPAPLKSTPIARGAENDVDDAGFQAPKPKSKTAGRGTKRGSRNAGSIDDDDESYLSTPTKQQKTAGGRSFRSRPNIDYSKQLAQADDDGDDTYEDDEAAKNHGLAQQHESPASNKSFHEERHQGFNAYAMVDAPTPAQSNQEFGGPTPFDCQPVNGSGGVAGFRSYDSYAETPFTPSATSRDFPNVNHMPPFAFNNSNNNNNENPLMSGVHNSNKFMGGNHYNISGTMGVGGNRATNNEMANNYNKGYAMGGVNNDENFMNGVPRVFTQQNQGGFNANAVMKEDSDTYFTSSPTDMTDGNPCITPATTQDSFTPMPPQQFVDPSKTNRLYNSYDSGYYDSQMGGNDFYDHDTHFDAFPHDPAFDADHMFDGFAPGDEHSMFHPMDSNY